MRQRYPAAMKSETSLHLPPVVLALYAMMCTPDAKMGLMNCVSHCNPFNHIKLPGRYKSAQNGRHILQPGGKTLLCFAQPLHPFVASHCSIRKPSWIDFQPGILRMDYLQKPGGRICGRAEKLGGRNGSRNLSRRRTFAASGIHRHNYVAIDLPALYGGIRKGGCCHIGGVYLRVRSAGSRRPVHVVT